MKVSSKDCPNMGKVLFVLNDVLKDNFVAAGYTYSSLRYPSGEVSCLLVGNGHIFRLSHKPDDAEDIIDSNELCEEQLKDFVKETGTRLCCTVDKLQEALYGS